MSQADVSERVEFWVNKSFSVSGEEGIVVWKHLFSEFKTRSRGTAVSHSEAIFYVRKRSGEFKDNETLRRRFISDVCMQKPISL